MASSAVASEATATSAVASAAPAATSATSAVASQAPAASEQAQTKAAASSTNLDQTPGTKEVYQGGHWYLKDIKTGKNLTGWQNLSGKRVVYYDPTTAQLQYGEHYIGKQWYYFDKNTGALAFGWTTLPDGRRVYYDINSNGQGRGMLHGDQIVGDQLFRLDANTGALRGTLKNVVYFDQTTKQILYVNGSGRLVKSAKVTLGGKTVQTDAKGYIQLKDGENQINGQWYLYDAKNKQVKTGWQTLGKRTVYYDPTTAQMVHGERYMNNAWYYFDIHNGDMAKTWTTLPDGRRIYYQTNGHMYKGELFQDGYWYYLNKDTGAMATGFTKLPDGRLVYYNNQGHMIYGWQNLNGQTYYFNKDTGAAAMGNVWVDGKEYYFDTGTGAQLKDWYTTKLLSWFYHRMGKLTYSMGGSRNGSDGTADCSGSVTQALYEATGVRYSWLYNTESLHSYLTRLGYHLVHENSGYNDYKVADVIIWGRRGYSSGGFGHTGIMTGSGTDAKMISTCYYTKGQPGTAVQNLTYTSYWAYDNYPYYYVYRR